MTSISAIKLPRGWVHPVSRRDATKFAASSPVLVSYLRLANTSLSLRRGAPVTSEGVLALSVGARVAEDVDGTSSWWCSITVFGVRAANVGDHGEAIGAELLRRTGAWLETIARVDPRRAPPPDSGLNLYLGTEARITGTLVR